jgi:hypothetical protein
LNLASNTDHPVLPPPPFVPRLNASWTLAPLSSGASHLHFLIPRRTTDCTVLVAPESWIIQFWNLHHPVLPPAPLLAVSLLIPCTTTGRTVLVSGRSRITYHPVLDCSALGGGDQYTALQYGKGIYFLHYVMVVCLFLMMTIILIAKLLHTSLINDKNTKQKH